MQLGLVDSPILPPPHTRAVSEGEKPVFSMLDISIESHSLLAFHLQTDLGGRTGGMLQEAAFQGVGEYVHSPTNSSRGYLNTYK